MAAGGAAGAGIRWIALGGGLEAAASRPSTLALLLLINATGSLVLGVLATGPADRSLARDVAGIGVCGGLTTFSTVAVELVQLAEVAGVAAAAAHGTLSVAMAITAFAAGSAVARRRTGAVPGGRTR